MTLTTNGRIEEAYSRSLRSGVCWVSVIHTDGSWTRESTAVELGVADVLLETVFRETPVCVSDV